jgi:heterotetrameric sarcosine oxidase gamma subunit
VAELLLTDLSSATKWRAFSGYEGVRPGTSRSSADGLVWSVSPGEWTVLGGRPAGGAVDLTHVRAMFRLAGSHAAAMMNRVCALDFSDGMFPRGAAARTLFAGVATEIVREENGTPSYLLLPSRSYHTYILDVIRDAGSEFDLAF